METTTLNPAVSKLFNAGEIVNIIIPALRAKNLGIWSEEKGMISHLKYGGQDIINYMTPDARINKKGISRVQALAMAIGGNNFTPKPDPGEAEAIENETKRTNLRLVVSCVNQLIISYCSDQDVAEFIQIKKRADQSPISPDEALAIAKDNRKKAAEILKDVPVHRYLDHMENIGDPELENTTTQTQLAPLVDLVIKKLNIPQETALRPEMTEALSMIGQQIYKRFIEQSDQTDPLIKKKILRKLLMSRGIRIPVSETILEATAKKELKESDVIAICQQKEQAESLLSCLVAIKNNQSAEPLSASLWVKNGKVLVNFYLRDGQAQLGSDAAFVLNNNIGVELEGLVDFGKKDPFYYVLTGGNWAEITCSLPTKIQNCTISKLAKMGHSHAQYNITNSSIEQIVLTTEDDLTVNGQTTVNLITSAGNITLEGQTAVGEIKYCNRLLINDEGVSVRRVSHVDELSVSHGIVNSTIYANSVNASDCDIGQIDRAKTIKLKSKAKAVVGEVGQISLDNASMALILGPNQLATTVNKYDPYNEMLMHCPAISLSDLSRTINNPPLGDQTPVLKDGQLMDLPDKDKINIFKIRVSADGQPDREETFALLSVRRFIPGVPYEQSPYAYALVHLREDSLVLLDAWVLSRDKPQKTLSLFGRKIILYQKTALPLSPRDNEKHL